MVVVVAGTLLLLWWWWWSCVCVCLIDLLFLTRVQHLVHVQSCGCRCNESETEYMWLDTKDCTPGVQATTRPAHGQTPKKSFLKARRVPHELLPVQFAHPSLHACTSTIRSNTVAFDTVVHPNMNCTIVWASRSVLLHKIVHQVSLPFQFVVSRGLQLVLVSPRKIETRLTAGWAGPQWMLCGVQHC